MKKLYFLFAVTILLLSCATLSPATMTPTPSLSPAIETPVTLPGPTDPTQTLVAKAGETFDIVLPANSSTGYRWKIISNLDASLVQLVEENYFSQQPVMPGSGGVDVWTFSALAPGETTIEFGFFPPSNPDQPDKTVTFTVSIE